ncbi:MAG: 50S ribosomal protein L14e [Candidatus Diapherotrites archaeon]|nr:50S ribosomal protein L14e [Candidatus Diapherotrites archaeon]
MSLLEIGRVCIKTKGRDAGNAAVIVDVLPNNFVVVEGPKVRRRKCNSRHLIITDKKIDISKESDKREIYRKINEIMVRM